MSHPKKRLLYMLAAALALFTALTGMAQASVPGLQRVTATSVTDSSQFKQSTAACPPGKQLVGGGGRVLPNNGQVTIDGITPDVKAGTLKVKAFEDVDGTSLRWALDAFAMCADPLPGLEQVDVTSPSFSFDHVATAGCPTGKELVGAYAETNLGGRISIDDVIPKGNSVSVFGIEIGSGTTTSWTITAHALCADPLPGREVRTLESGPVSSNQGVVLACSAGKQLLGLSGEMTTAFGESVVDDITPNTALTGGQVSGREVQGGNLENWKLRGYAICA